MCTSGIRAALCGLAMLFGCAREPEAFVCPQVDVGEVVVTELRGSGGTYGHWIELRNGSGDALDLRGMQLVLQRPSGSGRVRIIVRADELWVEAGEYAVLGHHEPGEVPEFVDYSFFGDFFAMSADDPTPLGPRELYDSGVLDMMACGEVIDRVVYPPLPDEGTWALDEDAERWCVDEFDPGSSAAEIGLPGTPGEANRPCAE